MNSFSCYENKINQNIFEYAEMRGGVYALLVSVIFRLACMIGLSASALGPNGLIGCMRRSTNEQERIMKISKKLMVTGLLGSLLVLGACQSSGGGSASSGSSTSAEDMVVARMAEGDVAAICKGGRSAISAASKAATTALAKAGKISGDYSAIGQAAGTAFYKAKCG
jgi:hypothetical protein